MKKVIAHFLILLYILLSFTETNAQNVNVNPGAGSYPTLKNAFDAINAGTHTGAIIITIVGNTNETASAVLNASGTVAASYTSILITPSGGASWMISGSIAGPLIDLKGADSVTIDGLNTGGNGLTISNTNSGSADSTSAIRFYKDASGNTVTNCTLLGSTGYSFSGVVFFSTGTTTGNIANSILNCNIGPAGANTPVNGIYSSGSTTAVSNSGTLFNNNIYDYYNSNLGTCGININTNNTGWTITQNRLYQTATRIYASVVAPHRGIYILSGAAYKITGNVIGFSDPNGNGTTNMAGITSGTFPGTGTFPVSYTTGGVPNATTYVGISCSFTPGGPVSSIQNNTVGGFALYTSSNSNTATGIFCGIAVFSGNVDIGTVSGNTIGASTGNSSIYAVTSTTSGMVAGMYVTSTNAVSIRNNIIGAINAMGTSSTISGAINGINISGPSSSYDVSSNIIGNSTNPNLRMGNLTTGTNLSNAGTTFSIATGTAIFNGILSTQSGTGTIGTAGFPNIIRNISLNSSNANASMRGITAGGSPVIGYNQISNMTTAAVNTTLASTLLAGMGIYLNGGTTNGAVVTKNIIKSLSLSNTSTSGTNISGIGVFAGNTEISYNKIYDINNASTSTSSSTPGTASGIFMRQPSGIQNVYNNMISLGNGQTTNTAFNGIWLESSITAYTLNCLYNTINIEGAASTGAQPGFCLNRGSYSATTVSVTVDIRDNIFNNIHR